MVDTRMLIVDTMKYIWILRRKIQAFVTVIKPKRGFAFGHTRLFYVTVGHFWKFYLVLIW